MRHGSLFSGIGGFDLAAEWMGWENIFHCEWNPFGQRVLKHHFPKAISYNDITQTDFTIHRGRIDIITGGFPCQPYSSAGKRLGKDDERHLWPHMLRCIREVSPRWVVGENVLGLVNWNAGLVFDEVQADLEAEGFEVQPYVLPAASVNAPHRRDRVWFVAYRNAPDSDSRRWNEGREREYHDNRKRQICEDEQNDRDKIWSNIGSGRSDRNAPDSECDRPQGQADKQELEGTGGGELHARQSRDKGNAPDSDNELRQRRNESTEEGRQDKGKRAEPLGNNQQGRESGNWQNFPTQPPICGGDDGLPRELDSITFSKWRNESIKAYGNAIVPQVAHQIFKAIAEYEKF